MKSLEMIFGIGGPCMGLLFRRSISESDHMVDGGVRRVPIKAGRREGPVGGGSIRDFGAQDPLVERLVVSFDVAMMQRTRMGCRDVCFLVSLFHGLRTLFIMRRGSRAVVTGKSSRSFFSGGEGSGGTTTKIGWRWLRPLSRWMDREGGGWVDL